MIDMQRLLAPVSPGHPSGEQDLEYDPAFIQLEEKVKGTAEVEIGGKIVQEAKAPNWPEIQENAAQLLTRTRDLRITVVLLRALLHTGGLIGMNAGLSLLQSLVERFWETLYPRLDSEDGFNPIQRINILMTLCDREAILLPLLGSTLCSSPAMGPCTLRDIHRAAGKLGASDQKDNAALSPAAIDAVFKDSDAGLLFANQQAVRQSLQRVENLEALLGARIAPEQAPHFEDLRRMLVEIDNVFERQAGKHAFTKNSASDKKTIRQAPVVDFQKQPVPTRSSQGEDPMETIKCRQDVTRLLEQICIYYQENEPASPVPLLLKRAAGLVGKDFFEIIQDMAPESVTQVQKLIGETKAKD